MAREGALEDPAVPPDVGPPRKHLPCPRKAPDVAGERPDPDVGDPKTPGAAQIALDAPDVAAEPLSPDVPWPKNGQGLLLVGSDTDVEEEEGPNPDVGPRERLKMTQNVPETPDVGRAAPNPDVLWLGDGCGALVVESDTDVEEADPDVEPPKRLRTTRKVPETPDVAATTPNPDVAGRGAELGDSDTDVEEEHPDVPPPKRLRATQTAPGIPDVEVEPPHPAVDTSGMGRWALLVESDTEEEEDPDVRDPDVQPPRGLGVTPGVPESPDVAAVAAHPDVPGWGLQPCRLRVDSDTDVEDETDPDVRPKIARRALAVDSDTDVEEDPDVEPLRKLGKTRNVSQAPDVQPRRPNPDVPGPRTTCELALADSDTDVEEDPDVRPPKWLGGSQTVPETPDVAAESPDPDVPGPEIGRRTFLVDSETDVEEEEDPDVQPRKKLRLTPDVPESPDVGLETPNPDVGRAKNGPGALLGDSETDVEEEEEAGPDVRPPKRRKRTQNAPGTPDVPSQAPDPAVEGSQREDSETDVEEEGANPDVAPTKPPVAAPDVPGTPDVGLEMPNPDVAGTQRGCGRLWEDSETDVEEEEAADPDVRPSKRRKTTPNLPESPDVGPAPPNPDVGGLQSSARVPEVAAEEEEEWDPDVATQLFLQPEPDVGEAGADPDVGSPREFRTPQDPPKIPDVEEEAESDPDVATQLFLPSPDVGSPGTPKTAPKLPRIPDVEEEPDPDVATQLFLLSPDVGSPKTAPKPSPITDVQGRPSLDPDVATQLFLPPGGPDVEDRPNPDVEGPNPPGTAPDSPKIPDVRAEPPDPDVEGEEEDFGVATQLFLPPRPDVSPPQRAPEIPDVEAETPNPDVGGPCPDPDVATQLFLAPDPDVERPEIPAGPGVPDVEGEPPSPDVGGAPGPAQEEVEAPPTPQVRRSRRLAERGGGGASAGPAPSPNGSCQSAKPRPSPKPRPPPKPRPQRRRGRAGEEPRQAPPSVPKKGSGRGSAQAPPPEEEESAEGAKRRLRPRAAPGPAPIRVLFTGLVASPALLVALGTLGGTEATSVCDCSHLVTDGIRRTLKFLCALGRGVPIVTPQWLLQSSACGRPLSPGPFLPQDPPGERRFGFSLGTSLSLSQCHPLLQGYQVHVTPSVQPGPGDMRDIVTCCGGTFLSQLPREHSPHTLVISCPQDRALWPPAQALGLPLLSAELLLLGVLRQRLELAPFLLCPPGPPNPPQNPKNPARNAKNPAQNPKNPARNTKNPAQNHKNPTQNLKNPAQNSKNPAQNHKNPTQNLKNPAQNPKNPTQTPKNPTQNPPNPPNPPLGPPNPPQDPPNPPKDPPNSTQNHKNPTQKSPKPPNPTQKTPNPTENPQNRPQKPQNRPQKPQNPPQKPPNPPQTPPQSPPRTRSGRRPPRDPPKKTPKRPRGRSQSPHPEFGGPDPPWEPPRTRSRRGPPQNPPGDPPKTPNRPPKTPNRPQKSPNRPQKAPNSTQKRPRGPPEGPQNPKFGVPEPPPSPPRTRSRRDPPKSQ